MMIRDSAFSLYGQKLIPRRDWMLLLLCLPQPLLLLLLLLLSLCYTMSLLQPVLMLLSMSPMSIPDHPLGYTAAAEGDRESLLRQQLRHQSILHQ